MVMCKWNDEEDVNEGVDIFYDLSWANLLHQRYISGILAREGNWQAAKEVIACNRLIHFEETYRDPDVGFDFTLYDYPSYDPQQDHFERFGRPAFPNEY